ncbi:MAG TPA: hypothetical protein PL143_08705 [Rhodocyclaceae bacterium]|nr:hypothetical protein [Rhodocyclaceae bacterium]
MINLRIRAPDRQPVENQEAAALPPTDSPLPDEQQNNIILRFRSTSTDDPQPQQSTEEKARA